VRHGFYYDLMPRLARKLDEITPVPSPTRTHFANSGTEAVETALKLAMYVTGRQSSSHFSTAFTDARSARFRLLRPESRSAKAFIVRRST
jgi:4-aminobutyrate aminotransferase-like enzyme